MNQQTDQAKQTTSNIIYHMVAKKVWEAEVDKPLYEHESLETEGFIHFTGDPQLLVSVANNFYRDERGEVVIVCVDSTRLTAELQWDLVGFLYFPHLYGPLNKDAVVGVVPFPREVDGVYTFPTALIEYE
ncbi:MAG: DUF952 domain-containing protein [Chloroflexota bacterium]